MVKGVGEGPTGGRTRTAQVQGLQGYTGSSGMAQYSVSGHPGTTVQLPLCFRRGASNRHVRHCWGQQEACIHASPCLLLPPAAHARVDPTAGVGGMH
jgi:hypothetical protein